MRRRHFLNIASGLAAYGHKDLAAEICDKTIANAIKNGISEHYDSVSGKALGVPDYCISGTLVTMMLDGLARKHQLKLRDKKPTDKEHESVRIPPCQIKRSPPCSPPVWPSCLSHPCHPR